MPHNAPRFDEDTESPYMVLQPLYATYTDPCRAELFSLVYGCYTGKQVYTFYATFIHLL